MQHLLEVHVMLPAAVPQQQSLTEEQLVLASGMQHLLDVLQRPAPTPFAHVEEQQYEAPEPGQDA